MTFVKVLDEPCDTIGAGLPDYSIESRATIVGASQRIINGSVGTTQTEVSFGTTSRQIELYNRDDTNDLMFSFDGSDWFNLPPKGDWSKEARATKIYLKASSGTISYSIIIGV